MAEYWQDIQHRAQATLPVWQNHFPELKIGSVGAGDYTDLLDALPQRAQERDDAVQLYDGAVQGVDFAFAWLRLHTLRVPAILAGVIDEESGLLDDLDKVYAIRPYSPDQAVARAKALSPVWHAANLWQVAQTPPRPMIVRGAVTLPIFQQKLAGFPGSEQAEADRLFDLKQSRDVLRKAAAVLDRLSKRFLQAGRGLADPGSAAEAALAEIPTESASPLPDTLGIKTLRQGGDDGLHLLAAYEPYDDSSATAKELQWMIEGVDAGWEHTVAVQPGGNALGPFVAGQVVRVRTRVTNASGTRESGVRQLTILAPPE